MGLESFFFGFDGLLIVRVLSLSVRPLYPRSLFQFTSAVLFIALSISMASKPSNEVILEQLKNGIAVFELSSTPVRSISTTSNSNSLAFLTPFIEDCGHRFFARIGQSLGERGSPAIRKIERYSVQKVTGDGRCLFRALVKGMAFNRGISLNPREEREDADELRMAVKEVICENDGERHQYEAALVAITVEESLKRYCQRIERPDFWGGESELLVLSKLCRQPITVYIPEHEHARGGWGSGFIPIAEYGAEFNKGFRKRKSKNVVRLLYSGRNHYDLLV
ncbi:OVARIAN TUMOR DOMAIN-containing deubiquitinating enzyme 3 isoform X1 [Ziziphus jujuba]|uniref:Ubiquitin thioesterase OTU n=1 Tax=Ziziphus jujuba TaxID=326968 RepID=A0ABM3I4T1_ZIZJJ|nr:OVARIAN TUMOR DOMAIN-containing deubiquitinating enzyme 3 isoform X1 [Ziziphus jujuba]